MSEECVPVITIDGPSGCGKGTVSQRLAKHFGWNFLDSGAIYRVLAKAVTQANYNVADEAALAQLAAGLNLDFDFDTEHSSVLVFLDGNNVTEAIREPAVSQVASIISAYSKVRSALLQRQRDFAQLPGLVTDGRDMGTVVFPEATVKIYLDASVEERARRRCKQLSQKGINVNLDTILTELKQRDERDAQRAVSPMKPAQDAVIVDTTALTVDETFNKALDIVCQKIPELRVGGHFNT